MRRGTRTAGEQTSEVEPTSERATAPGDRALEISLVPPAACTSRLGRACCHGLLLDLENGRQTRGTRAVGSAPSLRRQGAMGQHAGLFVEDGRLRSAFGFSLWTPPGFSASGRGRHDGRGRRHLKRARRVRQRRGRHGLPALLPAMCRNRLQRWRRVQWARLRVAVVGARAGVGAVDVQGRSVSTGVGRGAPAETALH